MKNNLITIGTILMCVIIFILGRRSAPDHECQNEHYKAAYLNIVAKIDSNAIYIKEK